MREISSSAVSACRVQQLLHGRTMNDERRLATSGAFETADSANLHFHTRRQLLAYVMEQSLTIDVVEAGRREHLDQYSCSRFLDHLDAHDVGDVALEMADPRHLHALRRDE